MNYTSEISLLVSKRIRIQIGLANPKIFTLENQQIVLLFDNDESTGERANLRKRQRTMGLL